MNYFLDTEFLEGTQKTFFGKTKPTIDLISIGIVCENGNTYYAISNEFNLKDAWNRYDTESYYYQFIEILFVAMQEMFMIFHIKQ